jgi:hypothetical protein
MQAVADELGELLGELVEEALEELVVELVDELLEELLDELVVEVVEELVDEIVEEIVDVAEAVEVEADEFGQLFRPRLFAPGCLHSQVSSLETCVMVISASATSTSSAEVKSIIIVTALPSLQGTTMVPSALVT